MAETAPRVPYQQRERRYVVEYVMLAYPNCPVFFNLRVGALPQDLARRYPGQDMDRLARVWKRFADAVVVLPDSLVLIETKLRRPTEAIGEIISYRAVLWETPELQAYGKLPVRCELVTVQDDPQLRPALVAQGIQIVIYAPQWALDYLREVNR